MELKQEGLFLDTASENAALGPWSYYKWEESDHELGPKVPRAEEAGDVAQLVECLPRVHRALGSIHSTT